MLVELKNKITKSDGWSLIATCNKAWVLYISGCILNMLRTNVNNNIIASSIHFILLLGKEINQVQILDLSL